MTTGNGWSHVKWTLTNVSNNTMSVAEVTGSDGGTLSSGFANLNLYKYAVAPKVVVGIPFVTSFPSSGWRFRVDNVVVTLR